MCDKGSGNSGLEGKRRHGFRFSRVDIPQSVSSSADDGCCVSLSSLVRKE